MNKNIKRAFSTVLLLIALFILINKNDDVSPQTQISTVVQTEIKKDLNEATTTSPKIKDVDYYIVSRVVDGDTIEVSINGLKEKVRLIGINTPETVDPRKKVECFGKQASDHAKEILTGKKVRLVTDDTQTKYDKYGRLLAYVYTDDGLFVNKHMIAEGYAYEYTYSVPYIFQKEFKEDQISAQYQQKGLWKAGVCE
ncbi:MAG: thermonuclease family protein [Minisyncoccota bacterium]